MTLVVAWLVFPALLLALALGCGLLLEAILGLRVPGALLPGVGIAVIVVVAGFATMTDATAELSVPIVLGLAIAGLALSIPGWDRGIDPWAVAAAAVVLAAFAAPIVLSGDATFAGFLKLDDTATWFALTDRVMEHGRSLAGLEPSSYEATLDFNLGAGYPVGAFLPLGVGRALVGRDLAWVFQPYLAVLASVLALGLWETVRPLVRPPGLRFIVVFCAAQPALLLGYYLWGGIKEVAAAALLATFAPLAIRAFRSDGWRFAVPAAVVAAAVVQVLSAGGVVWLAPALAVMVAAAWRSAGAEPALRRCAAFLAAAVPLSLPLAASGALLPPTSSSLTSETAQGNLLHPLSALQLFGVWPSGDFRLDPADLTSAHLLIAVVAAAGLLGLALAWRARAWALLAYVGGTIAACLAIVALGSPWVDAKALATASPAAPLAAAAAGAVLFSGGRRVEGGLLLAVIAGGILWSSVLAYRDVNLAPRGQLAELEAIGHRIGGEGPTLMTEYEPYGVRHFLRDGDPEGASELRRRQVPLRTGATLEKGFAADTDRFQLAGLLLYRTLVLRRSPGQSRPPLPYRPIYRGRYYEAWQRPPGSEATVLDHLPLGNAIEPAGIPSCGDVMRLARLTHTGGRLAAVRRSPVTVVALSAARHPRAWFSARLSGFLLMPTGAGTISADPSVPAAGTYTVWLGGSVRGRTDLLVDGAPAGSARHQLNNAGQYVQLGELALSPGPHRIDVRLHAADLHPGSGGRQSAIGPIVLSRDDPADARLSFFEPGRARQLCRGRWDWVEAVTR